MPKMVAAECIKLKRNSILGIVIFLLSNIGGGTASWSRGYPAWVPGIK